MGAGAPLLDLDSRRPTGAGGQRMDEERGGWLTMSRMDAGRGQAAVLRGNIGGEEYDGARRLTGSQRGGHGVRSRDLGGTGPEAGEDVQQVM